MDNRPGRFRYNRSGVPPSGRLRRTRSGVPYLVYPTGARKHNIVDRATAGGRQQLNAHKCVVNEVTVLVEYLKCALKAIKRLARAHSDLIVGVFAAGQPIHTDTERRGG
ncbi:hypothetical protein LR48_Vigan09g184300 [Vigna angularis]|uniref:Uncharacterized protein n=1 Tax=Phaseolus angularis TaxID=3914 RepID=A0A0L9VES1_PHAAN|nr:hypothetical protein LR48_Vigan09g184300 [Vigna angularis]